MLFEVLGLIRASGHDRDLLIPFLSGLTENYMAVRRWTGIFTGNPTGIFIRDSSG
jgi:hypothetical protein